MDEHARGTLRFIKLLTELSFTSFQVTSQLGALSFKSQSGGGAETSLYHRNGCHKAWGKVALAQSYMAGAESELESPGVLMPRPVFSVSTLDKKYSQT